MAITPTKALLPGVGVAYSGGRADYVVPLVDDGAGNLVPQIGGPATGGTVGSPSAVVTTVQGIDGGTPVPATIYGVLPDGVSPQVIQLTSDARVKVNGPSEIMFGETPVFFTAVGATDSSGTLRNIIVDDYGQLIVSVAAGTIDSVIAVNTVGVVGRVDGVVRVCNRTRSNVKEFIRPSNTTAYSVGDLVADSTTAGSVTPLVFNNLVDNSLSGTGEPLHIVGAKLFTNNTTITNGSFRLHLYDGGISSITNGDNGPWLTSHVGYVGSIDFTLDRIFNQVAASVVVVSLQLPIALGTDLYGLLEARGAYSPLPDQVFAVELRYNTNY